MIAHINKDTKEEQSVSAHLKETGELAWKIGIPLRIPHLAKLTAYFHDMGKWRIRFENYLRTVIENPQSIKKGSVNHSSAGAIYIYRRFYKKGEHEKLTAQLICTAIMSHHGLADCLSVDGKDIFHRRLEENTDELEYEEVLDNFENDDISELPFDDWFQESVNEVRLYLKEREIANISKDFALAMLERILLSVLIDVDRLNTAIFAGNRQEKEIRDDVPNWKDPLHNLDLYMKSLPKSGKINIYRNLISDECYSFAENGTGIYTLQVPTGGGKTLSSMRYALKHAQETRKKRIFYIAPYISVLEQNSKEYRDILKKKEWILEHHSNVIPENREQEKKTELNIYKHMTENWDQKIVLTTFIQFLNTLFSGSTQAVRRFHNLSDAVIIIDEIQSLPLHMTALFNMAMNVLNQLFHTTIVLCSATQPLLGKVSNPIHLSDPASIISSSETLFRDLKRTVIEPKKGPYDAERTAELVEEILQRKRNVLVILNTKAAVRRVYQAVCARCKTSDCPIAVMHLSNNMVPEHRIDSIQKMKKKLLSEELFVCISTSLIEAGVDVSFQSVVRSYAGLDSIAQAAGRCNRNAEDEDGAGIVYVIRCTEENLGRMEEIEAGGNISKVLIPEFVKREIEPLAPQAMDEYYIRYFGRTDAARKMNYPIEECGTNLVELLEGNPQGCRAYSTKQGVIPDLVMKQAFGTAGDKFEAIKSNTTGVLVPYKKGEELIKTLDKEVSPNQLPGLLKDAQRYTVNLFPHQIDKLMKEKALMILKNGNILALKEKFYDLSLGIVTDGRCELSEE
ncbi:CRISPR-associated helicase Cas3' [Diplocloster hominis]|uniref:CRISPR-associated helicase Cas3' n=1 Tax=Diplocloster hominis TaxID=3079010 RepID=UPI0031BA939F